MLYSRANAAPTPPSARQMLNGIVEVQNPEPMFAAMTIPKPSSQASLGPLRDQHGQAE